MKITAFIIFWGIFLISCSQTDVSTSVLKTRQPVQILEITNDFSGLYWMNGEVLTFRLYNDKSAEYDEYPQNKTQYKAIEAEKVKTRKHIKIDDKEFEEITSILTSPELINIEIINPQKSCIDAFIETKISYRIKDLHKQITIKDHCSTLADPKSTATLFNDFNHKVNDIFEILTKIKNKESAGKFYN